MKWISCLDKVPGNERKVIVWLEEGSKQLGPYIGSYKPLWYIYEFEKDFFGEVTYWAEITPPDEE